ILAVRRSGDNQYNRIAKRQIPIAMDDQARLQLPAALRLRFDLFEFPLRHAGIMLKAETGHRAAVVEIADQPCEADNRADIGSAFADCGDFRAGVKRLALYADHLSLPSPAGKRQPHLPPRAACWR